MRDDVLMMKIRHLFESFVEWSNEPLHKQSDNIFGIEERGQHKTPTIRQIIKTKKLKFCVVGNVAVLISARNATELFISLSI